MEMLFILAQVVGVFSLVLYCISMQINKRLTLLFFLMFVNILNALVYCLLGSVAGCFISLISVARLILFTWFDMNNLKCLIECQGEQHYKPAQEFGGINQFENQVKNDELKRTYAKEHNIPLIEIPFTCNTYEKEVKFLKQYNII